MAKQGEVPMNWARKLPLELNLSCLKNPWWLAGGQLGEVVDVNAENGTKQVWLFLSQSFFSAQWLTTFDSRVNKSLVTLLQQFIRKNKEWPSSVSLLDSKRRVSWGSDRTTTLGNLLTVHPLIWTTESNKTPLTNERVWFALPNFVLKNE